MPFEFYHIDTNLEPVFDYNTLGKKDGFLYTNYFGLKDDFSKKIAKQVPNLILDNAQSFFSKPLQYVDTMYSTRKYFGVSDGAYLFCDSLLDLKLEEDVSYNRMSHLLIRADSNPEEGYAEFIVNDDCLKDQPIKAMSKLTKAILSTINYENVKTVRIRNYEYLHQLLKDRNLIKIEKSKDQVPQCYPFRSKDSNLRKKLIKNRIYCPIYWPNVKEWCLANSLEYQLMEEVIFLPLDQRYNELDMQQIVNIIDKV